MTRPSTHSYIKLRAAGRRLLAQKGVAALSVRGVAKEAGVNLGLFHYHFRSKERFCAAILNDIYDDFFERFQIVVGTDGPLESRLKAALRTLAFFIRDNRDLVLSFMADILTGEKLTLQFLNQNFFRHTVVIGALIKEGQKKGRLRPMALPAAMSFLGGAVAMPSLMIGLMDRAGAKRPLGLPMAEVRAGVLSDSAIEERVDMAVNGLLQRRIK